MVKVNEYVGAVSAAGRHGLKEPHSFVRGGLLVFEVLLERLANSRETIAKLVLLEQRDISLA